MSWNFTSTDWSLMAAIASALAAFMSWKTAKNALGLQIKSAAFERERYLYESLKAYAEKANGYAKGKQGADWSFNDAANIVFSLNSAMQSISQHCGVDGDKGKVMFKKFFVSQLSMELFRELNEGSGPDAIFHIADPSALGSDVYSSWCQVVSFFGFIFVTDEDLAD